MARDKSTRERILDVALDLFVEQGYDKTSLRQIAERLDFTKAALYYHFPSKADILMGLHLRMHSLADEPLATLGEGPYNMERFEAFLGAAIAQLDGNEKLFLLHRNNQAAFTNLHDKGHEGSHEEMEEKIRKLLSDPAFGPSEKLKMTAAFAVAFFTPMAVRTLGILPTPAQRRRGPPLPVVDIGVDEKLAPALLSIVHAVLNAPLNGAPEVPAGARTPRGKRATGEQAQ